MNAGPVFVGGLAFSGKTPLRIALSAHSRLSLTRHTAMWSRFADRFGDLDRDANLERCLSAMHADRAVAQLRPDPARIRREFRQGPATYARLFALFHEHHAQRLGKPRWGDQMGLLEHYAAEVLTAYPDAQMIHMVRDPRARHAASAAGKRRRVPGKLGWETARWRYSAELASANARAYPGRYRILRFEDLAADPEATLRDVAAFLGEAYEPAMTAALSDVRVDGRGPSGGPGDPRASAGPGVSTFVERYARPQLAAMRYPTTTEDGGPRLGPRFYAVDWPCDRAGLAMWRRVGTRVLAPQGRG